MIFHRRKYYPRGQSNSLHPIQNSLDTAMDTADLCQVMRAALQTTSDHDAVIKINTLFPTT